MSVAKTGSDDANCGVEGRRPTRGDLPGGTSAGITVVAAAANISRSAGCVPAAYNQVITVSALADTDGKAWGLAAVITATRGAPTTETTRSQTSATTVPTST